jgi:hypothetical protein
MLKIKPKNCAAGRKLGPVQQPYHPSIDKFTCRKEFEKFEYKTT